MSEIDWSKAPEGATHYSCVNDMFYIFNGPHGGKYWCVSRKDWMDAGRIKEYSHMAKRPSPAWSGEGMPPVGTVCEALWNESRNVWLKTKVFGVNEHEQPVHRWEEGPKKFDYQASPLTGFGGKPYFRPIRTPEQIAADERNKACDRMYGVILDNAPEDRRKNGSDIVEALYDAGLRFSEQPK